MISIDKYHSPGVIDQAPRKRLHCATEYIRSSDPMLTAIRSIKDLIGGLSWGLSLGAKFGGQRVQAYLMTIWARRETNDFYFSRRGTAE